MRFDNPQKVKGLTGVGTELADEYLPIRLNGDLALFQAIGALLVEKGAVDLDFVDRHTTGYETWRDHISHLDWDAVLRATGLPRAQIERVADLFAASDRTVICWAMGITQHRNAVATIKEITNVALLQGNIGKPGAGLCPVRGHSNVQGDRTMGIWEKLPDHFAERAAPGVRLRPAARARPRRRQHGARDEGGPAQGAVRAGRQLRGGHPRQRGDPRGDALGSTSTCRSRPSSTAPTCCPGGTDARAARAWAAPRRTCGGRGGRA